MSGDVFIVPLLLLFLCGVSKVVTSHNVSMIEFAVVIELTGSDGFQKCLLADFCNFRNSEGDARYTRFQKAESVMVRLNGPSSLPCS